MSQPPGITQLAWPKLQTGGLGGLCLAMLPSLITTLTCLPGQSSQEGEIISKTDEQRQ